MFLRRLDIDRSAPNLCATGNKCPAILELLEGDFAVIGADITEAAQPYFPAGTGCGPGERVVRIPRKTLVLARDAIPSAP